MLKIGRYCRVHNLRALQSHAVVVLAAADSDWQRPVGRRPTDLAIGHIPSGSGPYLPLHRSPVSSCCRPTCEVSWAPVLRPCSVTIVRLRVSGENKKITCYPTSNTICSAPSATSPSQSTFIVRVGMAQPFYKIIYNRLYLRNSNFICNLGNTWFLYSKASSISCMRYRTHTHLVVVISVATEAVTFLSHTSLFTVIGVAKGGHVPLRRKLVAGN